MDWVVTFNIAATALLTASIVYCMGLRARLRAMERDVAWYSRALDFAGVGVWG